MKDEKKNASEQPEVNVAVVTPPADGAQAAEEPQVPAYRKRLSERYPDFKAEKESEWDDLAEKAYAEDEEKLKNFEDDRKVIDEVLASDKDLSAVVAAMIVDHIPFRAALGRYMDVSDLEPKEGDDDYEYYQKSYEDRIETGKAIQKRAEERNANLEKTYADLDAYCAEKGFDDTKKQQFVDFINNFFDSLNLRKITPEMFAAFDHAMNYDGDMEKAREDGMVDGRNESIEAKRAGDGAKKAGDGVPTIMGGGGAVPEEQKKVKNVFNSLPERRNF